MYRLLSTLPNDFFFLNIRPAPGSTLFPYTTLFRSQQHRHAEVVPEPDYQVLQVGSGLRSEEHTSELQSRGQLVCRLLLEKKYTTNAQATAAGKNTLYTRAESRETYCSLASTSLVRL